MSHEFEKCLERGRLMKTEPDAAIIQSELEAASGDLRVAEASFRQGNAKWAIVQAYYAMFHAAKALIYAKGYKERSHSCLLVALQHLYGEAGQLGSTCIQSIMRAMDLREEADYELRFSKESAKVVVVDAKAFVAQAKKLLEL